MKKILFQIFLLISISGSALGAITGDGSYGTPYTGTITSSSDNLTISGTKYFDQITVSGGGTLTISPRAIVFAKNTISYITISGTGILNAAGTTGNLITFTADNDGDGDSEPGESWNNITFEESSGTSVIDYAVIERGRGNPGYGLGGGILIYGNNITVSNTTIANCSITNGDGGGIYLYPLGSNVTLQNLILNNNSATGSGGGLYIDGDATATLTGCTIYSNSASNGNGVFFASAGIITNSIIYNHPSGNAIFVNDPVTGATINNCVIYNNNIGIYFSGVGNAVNCDIVNNATGIRSPNSIASKIVNTVLWGNTTNYNISGGTLELAYCGIQGGLSGGTDGGGNKTLSATNEADTGPNFVNKSTPDFHLNAWISPLVDGGTSSYTGVTIPGTDIEGKSRIGTLDIGAYEFLYFKWTGNSSTDWSTTSNWEGSPASVPTSITDNKVIIPKGRPKYPTATSLSLSTRSVLTIEPEAGLTVTGATTVGSGCTFLLESDATGSANFITGSTISGTYIVKLFLAGGGGPDYKWHYVTTPLNDYAKVALTTDISNPYNLLNYLEEKVATDKSTGWNWHDQYGGTVGFSTLFISRGYNIYLGSDQTATFTGTILPGSDYSNSFIYCGLGDATQKGWNLIGNPFTSGVDANQFGMSNKIVDKSIYFTKDNQYFSWNTFTQTGTGFGVSNIVPALQGFFVHATTGLGTRSVTIPAASRLYTGNSLYKGHGTNKGTKESHDFPYLKFNISDNAAFTDESIIYFFNDATTAFDTDYDAYKLFSENQAYPQIYTVSDNVKLSINGLPVPDKITKVPLNLRIGVGKTYTINILDLENLSDCKVTLIHGTERIDLKSNPKYTFFADAGTITNMSIEFDMSLTTDINLPLTDLTKFWYSNGVLSIKIGQDGFEYNSYLTISDLNGKSVLKRSGLSLARGEIIEIPVTLPNGIYITSIFNNSKKLVKKISIVK